MAADSALESAAKTSTSAPQKRRKGCGCWTILLVLAGLLVGVPLLLALATFAWIRVVDSYALAEELELAREAGYPLTLEELDASYPTSPEIEAATEHWQRAIEIVASEEYRQGKEGTPIVDRDANEFAWGDQPLLPAPDNLQKGREFVATHRDALEAVQAARLAGATARFPVEFEKLLDVDLSHTQGLRELAFLLQLDLEMKLVDGDAEGAVEDVLSLVAVADSVANEPLAVVQTARVTWLEWAARSLATLLGRVELTDDQLVRLQEAFARQRPMDGIHPAIRGERYAFPHLTRGDWDLDKPGIEKEGFRLSADGDIAKTLEFHRRIDQALDQDDLAKAYRDIEPIIWESEEIAPNGYLSTFRYLNTCLTFYATEATVESCARVDAMCRLAEMAIAFERYRLKHGALPPSPDAIVPAYIDALPIDIFDGAPVRWRIVEARPAEKIGPLPPEEQIYPEDAEERIVKPAVPAGTVYYSIWDQKDDGGIDDEGGFDQTKSNDLLVFVPDRVQPGAEEASSESVGQASPDDGA